MQGQLRSMSLHELRSDQLETGVSAVNNAAAHPDALLTVEELLRDEPATQSTPAAGAAVPAEPINRSGRVRIPAPPEAVSAPPRSAPRDPPQNPHHRPSTACSSIVHCAECAKHKAAAKHLHALNVHLQAEVNRLFDLLQHRTTTAPQPAHHLVAYLPYQQSPHPHQVHFAAPVPAVHFAPPAVPAELPHYFLQAPLPQAPPVHFFTPRLSLPAPAPQPEPPLSHNAQCALRRKAAKAARVTPQAQASHIMAAEMGPQTAMATLLQTLNAVGVEMTRVVTSNHALASSVGGRSSAPAGIIKLAEIKEYDGRGDVNSFLFQVEDVYSLFPNLSDEQKIVSASVRQTGLAQSWYRSARADTTLTWESFKTGLKAAFKSKSEAAKARDILHDAKQKHNQTALSFATHLRGLFLQIPNITDDEQLDRFRRGLHPALRAMVDVQLPDSFDKAVNIAVAHDSAYRDAGVSTATPMHFLGLANFYRRFVKNFSDIAAPITALTQADGHDKQGKVAWGPVQQSAFEALKKALTTAPVLIAPDPSQPYTLRCDASGIGIGAVLTQGKGPAERVVAYHSRKLLPAERNYPTHEQELLSVVEALKVWRHYLLGVQFTLLTDNWANKHLQSQPHLDCKRQARWMEVLQDYNCHIDHIPGKHNVVADALSRRPDYQVYTQTLELHSLTRGIQAQGIESRVSIAPHVLQQISDTAPADAEYQRYHAAALAGKPRQFIIRDNLLYHTGRGSVKLYIPVGPLRTDLLCEAHDIPISGHLGRDKTYARLSRFYFWPRMAASVHDYVRTCLACQRNKSNTQRPIGLLQSLPVPQHRWEHVSLDLITQLPVTTSGHDAIVVFVDKLTKMIHAIPTTTSVTASTLARIFFDHVFRLHGLPKVIVSDRDPRFTSAFWQELFKLTGTHLNMSTANHPQTDGQTERANRTLEDMLRNYVSPHHDDWDQHLTAAEFAYNASVQASTGYTPFRLNSGQEPYTPLTLSVPPSAVQGDSESASGFLQRMARDIASATHNLVKAQERQTTYANKKRRDHTFKVGDMVYLAHSFFAHTQPANATAENATRKYLPRQHGPFKVLEVVTPVALRLQFPPAWSTMHPVVHVSHIKLHNDGSAEFPTRNPNPPPEPEIIDGEEHFEVQEIRNHRFVRGKLQLQVKWLGHPDHENSWLPLEHLQEDLIKTFLKKIMKAYAIRTNQPKRWTQPAARA
ncbi:hypothetical protein QJQ45_002118 [Haematococcus lacustris]|nr:hypothetical protein QJQ45_002118 [Haematococcus lacustris]